MPGSQRAELARPQSPVPTAVNPECRTLMASWHFMNMGVFRSGQVRRNGRSKAMSIRIALALAAICGAGLVSADKAEAQPELVALHGQYSPGTIVVRTNERHLFLILDEGHAMRYPVGVGKSGK